MDICIYIYINKYLYTSEWGFNKQERPVKRWVFLGGSESQMCCWFTAQVPCEPICEPMGLVYGNIPYRKYRFSMGKYRKSIGKYGKFIGKYGIGLRELRL